MLFAFSLNALVEKNVTNVKDYFFNGLSFNFFSYTSVYIL